ncbi:MAG: TonB-dependent receptor [Leptospiraceae bacterium]|nr:TonB-dependent receptor [Leptospiraceae bacterium]MCP5512711.1 TonB-dependent receptor [Leptospiraceae bacterium]
MTKKLFLIALNLSIVFSIEIFSQESRSIFIGRFQPYQGESKVDIENKIQKELSSQLESKGYKVTLMNSNSETDDLAKLKSPVTNIYIAGYYKKVKDQNLSIYGQIYDTSTGKVINAYNLIPTSFLIEGIQLPEDEMREEDSQVIEKFVKSILLDARYSQEGKINDEKIEEYIVQSNIGKDKKFPLTQRDKDKALDSVFDLLNQTTISSTKIAKSTREVPNIVSVVQEKDITSYGYISINDILYQMPGFSASQDYDRRTVSSRGTFESWNNNHFMLLIDGVQFNDNQYGTAYTWEITPLAMVKSLEVIRGPGSALYGSNATNGVISLNTLSGKDMKGKIQTRLRSGSQGTQIMDISTGNTGKLVSHFLSYSSYQTEGNNYKSYDASGRGWTDGNGLTLYEKFKTSDTRKNDYIFLKLEGEDFLEGFSIQYHRQRWNYQTGMGWLFRIPDIKEQQQEERNIVSMKYSKNITSKLSHEYVVRYQKHDIDWLTRYAENGSYEDFYPGGVFEYLKTSTHDIFGRAQFTYQFDGGASFLTGIEANRFLYSGDKEHWSNAELSDSANGFPPVANGGTRQLGPWYEWIKDKPIRKGGVFAQLVSGKILNKLMEVTLGVRRDVTYQNFRGIDKPFSDMNGVLRYSRSDLVLSSDDNVVFDDPLLTQLIPNEKRSFSSTNPRLGLVFFPTPNLTIKTMAGTAFREPVPSEQFGANTWSLASNPRGLQPEKIKTYELAVDYFFNKFINIRINGFQTLFENMVAYTSSGINAYANIYSLKTNGVESELLFYINKDTKGFVNYSQNHRLDEKILDKNVSLSKNQVTWVPSQNANFGIRGETSLFQYSTALTYQGLVRRRTSDYGAIDTNTGILKEFPYIESTGTVYYRTKEVAEYYNLNLRLGYKWDEDKTINLFISNALNSTQVLTKSNYYTFDYLREPRKIYLDLTLRL